MVGGVFGWLNCAVVLWWGYGLVGVVEQSCSGGVVGGGAWWWCLGDRRVGMVGG